MLFSLTYGGIVENNADPLGLGRLKVRVPLVYGLLSSGSSATGYVGTGDIPWAMPAGLPAGGSNASGGISWLPEPGDKVWVRFLDGEPEKPIWEWGMQATPDAKQLKLHEYGANGKPDRAIISRYGSSLEFTSNTLTLTTEEGYQLLLNGSQSSTGGSVELNTPAGQGISLDDLDQSILIQGLDSLTASATSVIVNAAEDALIRASDNLTMMIGNTLVTIQSESIQISTGGGASLIIDPDGNIAIMAADGTSIAIEDQIQLLSSDGTTAIILEDGKLSLSAEEMVLNSSAVAIGTDAKWPAMMLTPEFIVWALTHTHTNGDNGSPTGPPIPEGVDFTQTSGSTRMSLT